MKSWYVDHIANNDFPVGELLRCSTTLIKQPRERTKLPQESPRAASDNCSWTDDECDLEKVWAPIIQPTGGEKLGSVCVDIETGTENATIL